MPMLSLVLVLAVVWMLFTTLKGALAHVATKLLWILCAFWVAASSYLMPTAYTTFLDTILTEELRDLQGAVLRANGYDAVHGLPELLYDHVIKKTWLEGEFGAADSPTAREQGPRLLDAQAWQKTDTTENVTQPDLDRKKATFEDVASKVRGTDAEGYFTGAHNNRIGTGLLGLVRGLCFAYFPLMALLGQLAGMLILRLLVLGAPILVPAVLNGMKTPLLQLLIMTVTTVIAVVLLRPVRQITGMFSGIAQAAGLNHATHPTVTGRAYRTWRRHRRWNKRHKQFLRAVTKNPKQHAQTPPASRHAPNAAQPENTPRSEERRR